MPTMNYDSPYARVVIHGKARIALSMQRTFANWGREQMTHVPGMAIWSARQWIGAFLLDVTGIPWLVTATTLDLAVMPRHDPNKQLAPNEKTTDDPRSPLPAWVVDLTHDDVSGAVMIRFIDGILQEKHASTIPAFLRLPR
jgi:hypothetical protein